MHKKWLTLIAVVTIETENKDCATWPDMGVAINQIAGLKIGEASEDVEDF